MFHSAICLVVHSCDDGAQQPWQQRVSRVDEHEAKARTSEIERAPGTRLEGLLDDFRASAGAGVCVVLVRFCLFLCCCHVLVVVLVGSCVMRVLELSALVRIHLI